MKKLLLAIIVLLLLDPVYSQNDCTIDEAILLEEKPYEISKRDARDIIKGAKTHVFLKDEIDVTKQISTFPFPRVQDEIYKEKVELVKVAGQNLPKWRTTQHLVSVSNPRTDTAYIKLICWMFLLPFLLTTIFISYILECDFDDNRRKYIRLGITFCIIFSVLASGIYRINIENVDPILYLSLLGFNAAGFFSHLAIFEFNVLSPLTKYISFRKRKNCGNMSVS